MGPDPDQHVPSAQVSDVQRMFREFAASYPDLRLYRAICEGAAGDDEVAGLLTAARPGQARPVLLLAALHELVLRRPDLPAARWYPSVTGEPVAEGDPWPDVRRTALAHAEELRAVIASRSTQTNEVNRVVYLAPLLARAAADVPGAPVALVELGASAGLLLGLDRYRIEVTPPGEHDAPDPTSPTGGPTPVTGRGSPPEVAGPGGGSLPPDGGPGIVLGDPTSTAVCAGVQRDGPSMGDLRLPTIVARVGLDRAPVPLDDEDEVRWLEACLWPDVPGRLERFRAAVGLLRADPPSLVAGDMVDDLEAVARSARAVATAALAPAGSPSGRPTGDRPRGHGSSDHPAADADGDGDKPETSDASRPASAGDGPATSDPRRLAADGEGPATNGARRLAADGEGPATSDASRLAADGEGPATSDASRLAADGEGPATSGARRPAAAGDAIGGPGTLGGITPAASGASAPVHLVVFSSWALTYVARERRPQVAEALATLAADGRPVSWLTAEPPGCVPGLPRPPGDPDRPSNEASTILGARRWRAGVELPPARWGTSHPHGTTLSWHPTP
ncbi:DUF2332 family protein [Iamia majanohamensis]|uniref:DUF2332 family protein n=1 Tax=Iamia majanohamensis TaxID=467976 RepID=A0AAF0BSI8_9ACTN|nr:DUF2332 family protein [Iamia majanohamensis]WCO68391.1 DUF2332 family protein [Iamia majanohamensis]